MAKVVTVMNMKGGVGKTTVTAHLAGVIARYIIEPGKFTKVLAIDYDPQFNLSQSMIPAKQYFDLEKKRKTTLSILFDDDTDLNPYELQVPGNHNPPPVDQLTFSIFKSTKGSALDLIPSTLDLMYVALGQYDKNVKPIEERFAKFITAARTLYDLVLIDCHPAGSLFTKTALKNSDYVLIPVAPQRYAVRGIGLMMDFISAKTPVGTGPKPLILFNIAPRVGISSEETTIRADQKFGPFCLSNALKKYKVFADPEEGKGFVWSSSKPYSTEAFGNLMRVAREFMSRIGAT